MRFPWRRAPEGVVRVSHKRLIELQRDALRVAELEQETAALGAEARALELLADRDVGEARGELLADLPVTAGGGLHEPAFLALVEARVWEQRERTLRQWRATTPTTND